MQYRTGTSYVVDALSAAGLHLGRIETGTHSGAMCCRPGPAFPGATGIPPEPPASDDPLPDPTAAQFATQLLESLLDDDQLAAYRTDGVFWVDTPRGRVRLGRHYDLRHVSPAGVERSLCVVPDTWELLPDGDVWATLLLWLHSDPDRFFREAIVNRGLPPEGRRATRPRPVGDRLHDMLDAELWRLEELFSTGTRPAAAVATGLPAIDAALAGLGAGNVVLVVGAPGSGRSALALGTAVSSAMAVGRRHEAGDPLRGHVLFRAPLGDPGAITRSLLAYDAMLRRQDLMTAWVLHDTEWRRIADSFGRLVEMPLVIDVAAPGAAPSADVTPALVVVDEAGTAGDDATRAIDDARAVARDQECAVMLMATASGPDGGAPRLADLPAGLVDRVEAVVALGQARLGAFPDGSGRRSARREVTPTTVSVIKNRVGTMVECRAVLVDGWGRFLPVLPAA